MADRKQTIMMTGGGTLGPVTPLLAIAQAWKAEDPQVHMTWIGTPNGPERSLVEGQGIPFASLTAPKLSRHRWWTWPFILPHFLVSCALAYAQLKEKEPDLIFTAGGFTSIAPVIVGRMMGIPSWVHQLDCEVGLANRIMAPFATRISVTWESSLEAFPADKTSVYGGIVRANLGEGDGKRFLKRHGLPLDRPVLFVTGGGTGARSLNEAMQTLAPELVKQFTVIHLTGRGKMVAIPEGLKDRYFITELLQEEMVDALAAADVVVSRAGMGTILELIALKKPTIFLPIVGSQQEENVKDFEEWQVARVLYGPTPQHLMQEIRHMMEKPGLREKLGARLGQLVPMGAEKSIVHDARALLAREHGGEE
jgi:UDP-N-acetylglucosamine--N-acetylmuramyl-(pentapeptide) pyrophosphoryl-undecaprenol N-acetylglucosamine transferase